LSPAAFFHKNREIQPALLILTSVSADVKQFQFAQYRKMRYNADIIIQSAESVWRNSQKKKKHTALWFYEHGRYQYENREEDME